MNDKNRKLTEENILLKAAITEHIKEKENWIKSAIKSDYNAYNTFSEAIENIENSIICMEECLNICKQVKENLMRNCQKFKKIKYDNVLKEKSINNYQNTVKLYKSSTDLSNEKENINKTNLNYYNKSESIDIVNNLQNTKYDEIKKDNMTDLNNTENINQMKVDDVLNDRLILSMNNFKKPEQTVIKKTKQNNKSSMTKSERLKCLRKSNK